MEPWGWSRHNQMAKCATTGQKPHPFVRQPEKFQQPVTSREIRTTTYPLHWKPPVPHAVQRHLPALLSMSNPNTPHGALLCSDVRQQCHRLPSYLMPVEIANCSLFLSVPATPVNKKSNPPWWVKVEIANCSLQFPKKKNFWEIANSTFQFSAN